MKKSAFSMVEIIFVIVIIALLAAIAVPKLLATRDDATFAKNGHNFVTLMNDIKSFYTANHELSSFAAMTNVPLEIDEQNPMKAAFEVHRKKCLNIELDYDGEKDRANWYYIELVDNPDKNCLHFIESTPVKPLLKAHYRCKGYYKTYKKQDSVKLASYSPFSIEDGFYNSDCRSENYKPTADNLQNISGNYHPLVEYHLTKNNPKISVDLSDQSVRF